MRKKRYIILLSVVFSEIIIISALDKMNIKAESFVENAAGLFLFFLPLQILLFLLSKDKNISERKRVFAAIVFWLIIVCYIAGAITTLF